MKPLHLLTALCLFAAAIPARAGLLTPDTAPLDLAAITALPGDRFQMPELSAPQIADKQVSIVDFGAVGDGVTLNTVAFARAMDSLGKGGGRVIVPAGIWLTGPIMLTSGIDLHVENNAVLLFSTDTSLYGWDTYPYRMAIEDMYADAHTQRPASRSPISAFGQQNIAITGRGFIYGSGDAWRPVKKMKMTDRQWSELLARGGSLNEAGDIWEPAPGLSRLRPKLVSLVGCKNVLIEGPTFQNSPSWTIHPLMCENLILNDVRVKNPWHGQNCDALDVESCKGVIIANCVFDTGDDGICVKSGINEDGRKRGRATEQMIVKDCVVMRAHGGFTIGSEMSGGVRDILVTGCTFTATDIGLRFKANRGRGNKVERIWIEKIAMVDIGGPALSFNLYYGGSERAGMMEVNDGTPEFRDITVSDSWCNGAETAATVTGLPEMPVANLTLRNVSLTAKRGITLEDAKGVTLEGVTIDAQEGPAIRVINGSEIAARNVNFADNPEKFAIEGERSGAVTLNGFEMK